MNQFKKNQIKIRHKDKIDLLINIKMNQKKARKNSNKKKIYRTKESYQQIQKVLLKILKRKKL